MRLIPKFIKSRRAKLNPFSSSSFSSFSSHWSCSWSFSSSMSLSPRGKLDQEIVEKKDQPILPVPLAHPSPFCPIGLELELEQAFCKFDTDGDKRISPAEVQSLLRCMGDDVSEEDALRMVEEADKNRDGFLDLCEFIDLMTTKPPHPFPLPTRDGDSHNRKAFIEEEEEEEEEVREEEHEAEDEEEQELRRAFGLFDRDGNGLISPEELQEMLWSLGEKEVSLEQCCQMIYAVDRNHDGGVDFQEFKAMMIGNISG